MNFGAILSNLSLRKIDQFFGKRVVKLAILLMSFTFIVKFQLLDLKQLDILEKPH